MTAQNTSGDFEIRPATQAEMGQIGLMTSYVYGGAFGDEEDNLAARNNRPEWTLCAFDGERLVTSYAAIPFTMRANGKAMAMAGVTIVGTLPEYRRRGLLRRITERSFETMRESGQTVAALWASQAAIYQRYGYSLGSVQRRYELDTVDARLLQAPDSTYRVSGESVNEAFDTLKGLYRRFIADRCLYLHRSTVLWQVNVLTAPETDGPVHIAVCRNGSGDAVGYVVYTLRNNRVGHPARDQELKVRDFVWLDIDACRSLWEFLARHDLVGRILWENAPADDPAWELFEEPRMLNARDGEGVYFRLVDAPAALAARGYEQSGSLRIGIGPDREAPWNTGTWQLDVEVGAGAEAAAAEVRATDGKADLNFSLKALGSAFSGFRRVRQLAAWGLVEGSAAAIDKADALFATRHAPHSPDHF